MGLIDKAGGLVTTAAGRVGAVLSDLPELPGVDVERLRVVIEVVWENRDFLVKLPSVLGDAGEQMQAAGSGAREVGGFLSGEVHELTAQAADTLEACRKPIAQVGEVLDELGSILDRLPIVGNVAEPATRGLGALTEVAVNIDRVAVQLRGLSVSMQGAGAGLDAMGVSHQGGGMALTTVSGRTIVQAASARRQATAEERSSRRTAHQPPLTQEAVDLSDDAPVDPPGADIAEGQLASTPTAARSTPTAATTPKVSATKRSTAAKRTTAKKTVAKKTVAKKTGARKTPAKRAATGKAAKRPARKAAKKTPPTA